MSYVKRMRHLGLTIFASVHYIKEIPPILRNFASRVFLFGGVPGTALDTVFYAYDTGTHTKKEFRQHYMEHTAQPYGYLEIKNFYEPSSTGADSCREQERSEEDLER